MNTEPIKNRMGSLSEEVQDARARPALVEHAERSRLEDVAWGSKWARSGLLLPIVISAVLMIGSWGRLEEYLPFIGFVLMCLIQGAFASVHSRIDAIYELMRINHGVNHAQSTKAVQTVESTRSATAANKR